MLRIIESIVQAIRNLFGVPADMTPDAIAEALDAIADDNDGDDLDWRHSVVDLLKVLDLDSGVAARKQLAEELGYTAEEFNDSAEMNSWLHEAVLKEVAQHDIVIPTS